MIRFHSSPPPPTHTLESIPDVADSESNSNPPSIEPTPFPSNAVDLNASAQKPVSKPTTGGFFKTVREKARKAFPSGTTNSNTNTNTNTNANSNSDSKNTTQSSNLIVNGHAEPEEIEALEEKKQQPQEFDAQFVNEELPPPRSRRGKSPSNTAGNGETATSPSTTSNYYRRRLKLDLAAKQQQLQQQQETANSSTTRQQAFRHRKAHTQPLPQQQKSATPLEAALATGAHFSGGGVDEHSDIAFKTALLQVSPHHHHHHLLDATELPPSTSGFCGSSGSLPVAPSISRHFRHPQPVMSTTEDTPSTSGAESCGGDSVKQGVGGRSSQPGGVTTSSPSLEKFHRLKNRYCTSFRIHIPTLKNPVDLCMLPDEQIAVADYDNGCVIVNTVGDVIEHKDAPEDKNACGVACLKRDGGRLFVLVFRSAQFFPNSFNFHNFIFYFFDGFFHFYSEFLYLLHIIPNAFHFYFNFLYSNFLISNWI